MKADRWFAALPAICVLGIFFVPVSEAEAGDGASRTKLFVIAEDASHERALMALAGAAAIRVEFESPGNRFTFSGEFTRGQVRAMQALGARFEPVEEIFPHVGRQRFGHLSASTADTRDLLRPHARPSCGDGKCSGHEDAQSCPADCGETPPPEEEGRTCEPQDREEYQTLLTSGEVLAGDGSGVWLFVVDTGTTVSHLDLDVQVCRDTSGRRVKNGCSDAIGHGTHTSGSAAANGGSDGLGLLGSAPGATLGVIKICKGQCFSDALVRGLEEAVAQGADIISLSFGASNTTTLRNAVLYATDNGILFFASAGNSGPDEDSIAFPAAYPEVVAVGILGADRIVSRMSSRGLDDGNNSVIGTREVELIGGGFVVESTWTDGCYEVLSGTSMSTPSVAGFAASHWQGSAAATRSLLVSLADDIDNAGILPTFDPSTAGWDRVSGYGLPRTAAGTDGFSGVTVSNSPSVVSPGEAATVDIQGPAESVYRVGVGSPDGDWTFGEFATDAAGDSRLTLSAWTDPGTWLVTVDFGGGQSSFGAGFDTFDQQ